VRILLLNRLRIGDCIFTTPAVRALRERFPKASITVVVPRENGALFAHNPHVDEVLPRPVSSWTAKTAFIRDVRRRRFDLVVSFQEKSIFYALTARFGGARHTLGLRHWRTRSFYRETVPWPGDLHRVERYLTLAQALGASVRSTFTELYPGEDARDRVAEMLAMHGIDADAPLVALNSGATEASRRWDSSRFAAIGDHLAETFDARILLLGSARDREECDRIAGAMRARAVNLAGGTHLLETAGLLERVALLVSGDTGPLHMAAALSTPAVALFGPSDPRLAAPRFGARGGRARILRPVDSCGRCAGPCLHAISTEECWSAVRELMEERRRLTLEPEYSEKAVRGARS
jgi:ADP-heptose:LPS heptosyltransferase